MAPGQGVTSVAVQKLFHKVPQLTNSFFKTEKKKKKKKKKKGREKERGRGKIDRVKRKRGLKKIPR
jgi:hypothetical protein